MEIIYIFLFIGILVLTIIVMRLVGAWMLRINEIIKNQYTIIGELRKFNANKKETL